MHALTASREETRIHSSTMRAMFVEAPGRARLTAVPVPEPGAGEVLVRVEGCGVCASNVPRWEGRPWFSYPGAPGEMGHEGVGRIASVGGEVTDWAVGDRVSFLSNGAYAEYDLAGADSLVRMPSELDGEILPGEPLGCAWNIFQRSGIGRGDLVAVVGVGFLGALVVQLARHAGARVVAVTRRPLGGVVLQAIGPVESLVAESPADAEEALQRLTAGRLCDIVIEATGKQGPLDIAATLTRVRGRLVIAGYHQDGPRQIDLQLWNWRGLDVINAHERDPAVYVEGMRRAFAAVVEGRLNPRPLITHRLPLTDLAAALELTRTRPAGFLKAIVHP